MSKVVVTRVVLNSETFGGQVPPHKPKADHESELATLRARVEELERERDEAEAAKCRWFETHLAHRAACDALGKANAEMFKRAAEAERKGEQAEENAERCRQIAVAAESHFASLQSLLDEARVALEPFAGISGIVDSETEGADDSDQFDLMFHDYLMERFTLFIFRRARTALDRLNAMKGESDG